METREKEKNKKGLFSATAIIMGALLIVIVANVVVWNNRLAKNAAVDSLTGEINQVSQQIQKIASPAADLEARLADAQAGLAAAQAVLPDEFNRNDIIEYIINLASECQVEVLPISSQGWTVEKDNSVLKLNGTLTGSFTKANEFISRLQYGKYETLVIPDISLTRQDGPVGTGTFSGDGTTVSVRLSISVYARPAAIVKGNAQ
jgi:hypothetical protein